MQGLRGTVRSSARVIPGEALKALSTINETPFRDVPTLVSNAKQDLIPRIEAPDGRVSMCSSLVLWKIRKKLYVRSQLPCEQQDSAFGTMSSRYGLMIVFVKNR